MKVHLRFDSYNSQHCHMTIFVNGKNNGKLIMSPAEAIWFNHILSRGAQELALGFVASGQGPFASEEAIDACAKEGK